ncbi:hypothetical protein BDBG_17166, partial [Blastomyces gilchristii SLH14081]
SSYVDRFTFTDNNKHLNFKSLIENLKNMIMKKLFILYIVRSFMSLSTLSVSFSATLSQSLISVSVSDSLSLTISVSAILTSTTSASSASAVSAFIISSLYFKKILYRLNKSHLSFLVTLVSEVILIEDDNITKTTLFYSQASFSAFFFFSAEKVVCTSDYMHL